MSKKPKSRLLQNLWDGVEEEERRYRAELLLGLGCELESLDRAMELLNKTDRNYSEVTIKIRAMAVVGIVSDVWPDDKDSRCYNKQNYKTVKFLVPHFIKL